MTYLSLCRKLNDKPFKPFRIRLGDGRSFIVGNPRRMIVGELRAVVVTEFIVDDRGRETALDWTTISIAQIVKISDLEPKERRRSA